MNSDKDICDKYCGKDPWTCGVNIGTDITGLDFSEITNVGDNSGKIRAVDCRSCHTIVPNHSCNGKIKEKNKVKSFKINGTENILTLTTPLSNLFRYQNATIKIKYNYTFENLILQLEVLKDNINEDELKNLISKAANIFPEYVEILSRKISSKSNNSFTYVVKLHRNVKNTFEEIKNKILESNSISNVEDITTSNWFTSQRVEGLGVGMGMLIGAAGLIGGLFYFIQRRKRLGSY